MSDHPAGADRAVRPRWVAAVLGVASTVGLWAIGDGDSPILLLALSAYLFSPWAFFAWRAESLSGQARRIVLAAMALMAAAAYVVIAVEDSSTAALVLAFLPAYQWAAIGIAGFIAWTPRGPDRDRERQDRAWRGLLAVASMDAACIATYWATGLMTESAVPTIASGTVAVGATLIATVVVGRRCRFRWPSIAQLLAASAFMMVGLWVVAMIITMFSMGPIGPGDDF